MKGEAALARLRAGFAKALDASGIEPGEPFPCPYLPGQTARHVTVLPRPLVPGLYHALMDLNFRRVGDVFYRPECDACAECRILRLRVREFRPTRSQRRSAARNADLVVSMARPEPSEEKYSLYRRYLETRHQGPMDGSREEFERFLYTSGIETLEVSYRADGRLVAVGIADVEPQALSAVYCYYDPASAPRSLGVFNVLTLIAFGRKRQIPYLYLGYYVRDCLQMNYKSRFRPCEVLGRDGRFARLTTRAAGPSLDPP